MDNETFYAWQRDTISLAFPIAETISPGIDWSFDEEYIAARIIRDSPCSFLAETYIRCDMDDRIDIACAWGNTEDSAASALTTKLRKMNEAK